MSLPDTHCLKCKVKTPNSNTPSDIEFKKSEKNAISLKTKCLRCGKKKSRFIGKNDRMKVPPAVRAQLDKLLEEEVLPAKSVEGGIFPLIPLIVGIIAAAAGASTAIAVPVLNKQAADAKQAEENRHHQELEKIARTPLPAPALPTGKGYGYGEGVEDDEEQIKQAIALLQGRGYLFT